MGEHMYRVVFPLMLLSSSALSQEANVFFSYSEWERMSDNQRSIYVTGAMDALMTYASNVDGPKLTTHFYSCLTKASLNTASRYGANTTGTLFKSFMWPSAAIGIAGHQNKP